MLLLKLIFDFVNRLVHTHQLVASTCESKGGTLAQLKIEIISDRACFM